MACCGSGSGQGRQHRESGVIISWAVRALNSDCVKLGEGLRRRARSREKLAGLRPVLGGLVQSPGAHPEPRGVRPEMMEQLPPRLPPQLAQKPGEEDGKNFFSTKSDYHKRVSVPAMPLPSRLTLTSYLPECPSPRQ